VGGLVLVIGDAPGAEQRGEDGEAGRVIEQVLLQERDRPGALACTVGDLGCPDTNPEGRRPLDRVAERAEHGLGQGGDRVAGDR
jgi:hypothetical protein